jgi:hypothetical protein
MALRRIVKKEPVEKLQEEHLSGPADEPIEITRKELMEDQIVIAKEKPDFEWVIFRNQRDPGHVLEFHAHTKANPFKQYKLIDGEKVYLPREVIRNLEACRENIEKYRRNSEGLPQVYIAGYKSHFVCERVA